MKSDLLKRCVRALAEAEGGEYEKLCRQLINDERGKGHTHVATQLEHAYKDGVSRKRTRPDASLTPPGMQSLRKTSDDHQTQWVRLEPEQTRHTMVLEDSVEERFRRIEQEYAARDRLAKHGLKPMRKILLYGPPGCGKSLGAERLAFNTGLPLLRVHFDTLISSYFGESASNLRKVFDAAHSEPCILFLDECDYIAKKRGDGRDVGEVSRLANTLLQLLDDYKAPGLLLAATNLDEMLDHAIFRRFDDVFCVPLPGKPQISALLRSTLSAIKTDRHIFWDKLAEELVGMSSASVVQVAEDAAKQVILEGRDLVTHNDLQKAITRIYRTRHQGSLNGAAKH